MKRSWSMSIPIVLLSISTAIATPSPLTWRNAFLGGEGGDSGSAVAVHAGSIYVAGSSTSGWGNPVQPHSGDYDAFISRFSSDGLLEWNTFLGGSLLDSGGGVAVDSDGNVYIAGISHGAWGDPLIGYSGEGTSDVFVAKLNADGLLLWNTFLGSFLDDQFGGIALDSYSNVYLIGTSAGGWGTPLSNTDTNAAFIAKLNSSGAIVWNTFIGGNNYDLGRAIAVDESGNVFVTGQSGGLWRNPPPNMIHGGSYDAFVAKLSTEGTLEWSTFVGGSGEDGGNGIAVDNAGNTIVGGTSSATWGSPVRGFSGGHNDAFVARLNAVGVLLWNSFVGSTDDSYDNDVGQGVALDANGGAYIVGNSSSSWGAPIFPFTGNLDAFVAHLDTNGSMTWNTYLGGVGHDIGSAVAIDGKNVCVAGWSPSSWGNPTRAFSGGLDAFVAKFIPVSVSVSVSGSSVSETSSSHGVFTITRSGDTSDEMTADYSISGTASEGLDFTLSPSPTGEVYFPPGEVQETVTVTTLNDSLAESEETVVLTLLDNPNYGVSPLRSGVVTISSDDVEVSISALDFTATEEGINPASMAVIRYGNATENLTVNYSIGGTASIGKDYSLVPPPSLAFSTVIPAGDTTSTIHIHPVNDAVPEATESIVATLTSGVGYTIGSPSSATMVIQMSDSLSLSKALDSDRVWVTGGDENWFGQKAVKHDGVDSARPDVLDHGQSSWLQTTVKGPASVSFWWKTSSDMNDLLSFYVDGVAKAARGGLGDWRQKIFSLKKGSHVVTWEFKRDASGSAGINSCFLDQVKIIK